MSGSGSNQSTRLNSIITSLENMTSLSAFGESLVVEPTALIQVHWPYNVNPEIVADNSSGSGSLAQADNMLEVHSGAATSSIGQMQTLSSIEYHPGQGVDARWTAIFDTGTAANTQISGIGDDDDGFFFGFNGTAFGILHRNDSSDTWVAQSSWNKDPMDGTGPSGETLDTTKGNVYRVEYQWLGYGTILFFIESSVTGFFIEVHEINYPNFFTVPVLANPTLPIMIESNNTSNDTDIVIRSGSVSAFIQGSETPASHTRNAISNTKAVTTELNVLSIQDRNTFASKTNKVRVQPDFLTFAADGTKSVIINIYLNTTLGGTPSFTNISTNTSVVAFDTAGTTISMGILIASFTLAKEGNEVINLKEFSLKINPGDILTISASSANSNDVSVAVSWEELW